MKTKRSSTPTASMTGEKAEENKEKFYFIPIGIFTKSFCGFTSRKGNVAREEALRIAKSDFPLSRSLLSGHA